MDEDKDILPNTPSKPRAPGGQPFSPQNQSPSNIPLPVTPNPASSLPTATLYHTASPVNTNQSPLSRFSATSSNRGQLWDSSKPILFAPKPISPTSRLNPRARPFSSQVSLQTPAKKKTPPISSPGKGLSGSASPTSPDLIGKANALYEVLDREALDEIYASEYGEEEEISLLPEEEEEEAEDAEEEVDTYAEIERVRTPEGIEIIMWRKKPIEYTTDEEPHILCDYQMPKTALSEASEASETWSYERYKNSEGKTPAVHYASNLEDMETLAQLFLDSKAIGFDMEWKPSTVIKPPTRDSDIRNAVSVIQIADEKNIVIFHLAMFPKTTSMFSNLLIHLSAVPDPLTQQFLSESFMSPTLKKIIEDPGILKTGVAVKSDLKRLATNINLSPNGILDVAELHALLVAAQKIDITTTAMPSGSLAALTEHYLGLPLDKGSVRTSNWAAAMTPEQKFYAANDAYASFRIYDELEGVRKSLKPRPALSPAYSLTHSEVVEESVKRQELRYEQRRRQELNADDSTPKKKTLIRVPKTLTPELEKAYDWVKHYAATRPWEYLKAAVADLRCYALWEHQGLDVLSIAAACRDPPLGSGYVALKILEAVRHENLPYNPDRLSDVFDEVGQEAMRHHMGRYYHLKKQMNERIRASQIQDRARVPSPSKLGAQISSLTLEDKDEKIDASPKVHRVRTDNQFYSDGFGDKKNTTASATPNRGPSNTDERTSRKSSPSSPLITRYSPKGREERPTGAVSPVELGQGGIDKTAEAPSARQFPTRFRSQSPSTAPLVRSEGPTIARVRVDRFRRVQPDFNSSEYAQHPAPPRKLNPKIEIASIEGICVPPTGARQGTNGAQTTIRRVNAKTRRGDGF